MNEEDNAQKITPIQRIGAMGYRLMNAVLRLTDVRLVALFGRCLGYLVWMASKSRRRIVARNMRIVVDPTLRQDKLSSMVRRNMVRTVMNLACSLKTGIMTDKEAARSILVVGRDEFEKAGIEGRTAICAVPHAGNWEILARTRPLFPKVEHYGCMYRRLTNPLLEKIVYNTRTMFGCEMFSKEDGLRAVFKLARSGGLLGVLSDQFTQEGLFIPYFGKVTGVTPLPALIHKRCKGKGQLFSVFTRNIALGKWEAIMNRTIELPEDCTEVDEITMQVNLAIEKCQKENILDGFWMHHRWKCTNEFAPENVFSNELIKKYGTLPFRMLVCMPERFEEAALLLPILRILKRSRIDTQIGVICPEEQKAYWQQFSEQVSYVVTTDNKQTVLSAQLNADEIYKDGPFDILFMFNEDKKVLRELNSILPVHVAGFANNPLTRKIRFNSKYRVASSTPRSRAEDYLASVERWHLLKRLPEDFAPLSGTEAAGTFIAPFSTLGSADSWAQQNWVELVAKLGKVTLLALPADKEKAEQMATELKCDCCICKPEEISGKLGTNSILYAVDGLLPTLAAQTGCKCTVLMASRHAERYPLNFGEGHRYVSNHTPCHPCHSTSCDQKTPCTAGVTVDDMLG
ncbi:MAG: lysophospholipid acyltransferase family protein [Akkermansia sp.]|nr:lysophospholipid acyltransferase family protein [Akkermansia sp.]